MAIRQSPDQKRTVERVMHEFKHGELKTARGARKVKNPNQAIAIALNEAGASNQESSQANARNLRRTKSKERRGETYQDEIEGHRATQRTFARATERPRGRRSATGQTRADLYAEAKRHGIRGRSTMSKAELERVLHDR
jgi:hypothetical protein